MTDAVPNSRLLAALLGAAATAAVVGALIEISPIFAVVALGAIGLGIATIRYGVVALVVASFGLLPWMVVLEGVLPSVIGTLTAAAGAGALLYMVTPLSFDGPLVPVAAAAFGALILGHMVFVTDSEQAVQAAKYMVFPVMVLALTSERGRELAPTLKTPVLGSCIAAMVFHIGVIAVGKGAISTYYGAGERLGFAAEGPHALALLAMVVAAVGLTLAQTRAKLAVFALGAVPAVLTGVRSALLGLAIALGIFFVQSSRKGRTLGILAAIVVVALVTGAMDVVTARFAEHPEEFNSFTSAGSGRGLVWTVAFDAWGAAGPGAWLFGTGLRSVIDFELVAIGEALVGHSDVVQVMVETGIVGFFAWAALWIGLLRARLRTQVLLPVLAFGVVNGTLEYVAPLTVGLFLAAACTERAEEQEAPAPAPM